MRSSIHRRVDGFCSERPQLRPPRQQSAGAAGSGAAIQIGGALLTITVQFVLIGVLSALSVLERLAERAQWRGTYSEALTFAQRMVALEPLLEMHQRTYMRLLALNGELAAALAQYRQLHALLAQELAVEPDEATTALFGQIRRGDTAGLQPTPPPFVVPMPPTPLVSRAAELQTICDRLRALNVRCLTITGTGGIGKTRLAIAAAYALRYDFEDGIYFVELAALSDATLVADAIAQTLGVNERSARSIGGVA